MSLFSTYIFICSLIYLFEYIHIYYLLTYYQPAFTVTWKKEKKPPGTRDKNISNHRPGEKRKNIIGQKKKEKKKEKRPTSSHQLKKIKRYAVNYKSAQCEVEPITKINLNHVSGRFLVNRWVGFWWIKMVFSPLSSVVTKLPDDPLRWNFSWRIPTRDLT